MNNPYAYYLIYIAFTHLFFAYTDSLPELLAMILAAPIGIGGFVLLLAAYEWLNARYGDSEQLLIYGLITAPPATWWLI